LTVAGVSAATVPALVALAALRCGGSLGWLGYTVAPAAALPAIDRVVRCSGQVALLDAGAAAALTAATLHVRC
jgi:spore maturation protein SpmB